MNPPYYTCLSSCLSTHSMFKLSNGRESWAKIFLISFYWSPDESHEGFIKPILFSRPSVHRPFIRTSEPISTQEPHI